MERSITEEQDQLKNLNNPLDSFDTKIIDLRLADSFLDFDSIKEFFEDNSPNLDRIGLEKIDFGSVDNSVKMGEEEKSHYGNLISHGSDQIFYGSGCMVKVEEALEGEKEVNMNCCIEEEMGKVSLVGVNSEIVSDGDESKKVGLVGGLGLLPADGSGAKSDIVCNEQESESDSDSESESESETSTSSSSTSSDDDDDDDEKEEEEEEADEDEKEQEEIKKDQKVIFNVPGELEEGEIEGVDGEEMVGGIDNDEDNNNEVDEEEETDFGVDVDIDDGGGGGGGAMEGPIRSENELQVLPPVPQVTATLRPHHQMLPVGLVMSVVGVQVIVEGVEKHNPLSEGSILWITESRSPLGLVDEIFGPVKKPYYVVRYNSVSEIPAGINVGTLISFVQEFANHVLSDKNLYKKGYDASGENDEELSDDAEFSDDEKEAEYRRKLKMEKRGMNDQIHGNRKNNRKKVKNKDGAWRNGRQSVPVMDAVGPPLPNQNRHHVSPVLASLDHCNSSTTSVGQGFIGGTGLVPQLQSMAQNTSFATSLNGAWTNGMLSQQPPNAFFLNGFPANDLLWPSQSYQQHPYQPMMDSGLFMQQFDLSQMSLPNVILPGGQSNFFGGAAYAPRQGLVGQNGLNQTIGWGSPGQPSQSSVRTGTGILLNGLHREQNNLQQAAVLPDSIEAPQQFNMSSSSSNGSRPYHRGGCFTKRRVRHQAK